MSLLGVAGSGGGIEGEGDGVEGGVERGIALFQHAEGRPADLKRYGLVRGGRDVCAWREQTGREGMPCDGGRRPDQRRGGGVTIRLLTIVRQ